MSQVTAESSQVGSVQGSNLPSRKEFQVNSPPSPSLNTRRLAMPPGEGQELCKRLQLP